MTRTTAMFAAVAMIATGAASTAATAGTWAANHPRRAEVNHRLDNQNARIHEERREGDITGQQAQSLHAQDRAIRADERAYASDHGGHISKAEQHALNQQENIVSREIPR
jgi:hypothetical protein